ncbi:MAG: hypothetical protein FWB91_14715 [Defluviitaleaceae bacterium]|nr:hypothetical protein [Defluviitaleaceae bacterium]
MQSFKQSYLMLFASPYAIENPNGTKNEGVTCHFLMTDNLAPKVDQEAAQRGQSIFGMKPNKMSLPITAMEKIKAAPAMYECTVKMITKSVIVGGRQQDIPSLQIIDVDYIGAIDLPILEKLNKNK